MLSRMRRILAGVAAALLALPAANTAAETEKELQPYAEAAAEVNHNRKKKQMR